LGSAKLFFTSIHPARGEKGNRMEGKARKRRKRDGKPNIVLVNKKKKGKKKRKNANETTSSNAALRTYMVYGVRERT